MGVKIGFPVLASLAMVSLLAGVLATPSASAQEENAVFSVSPGGFTAQNVPVGELYISRDIIVVWNRDNVPRAVSIWVEIPPAKDVTPGYEPIPSEDWVHPSSSSFMIEENSYVGFRIWLDVPQSEALKGQKWEVWIPVERQPLPGETAVLRPTVRMRIETTEVHELTSSVEPSEGGSVSLNPPGGTYDQGTKVIVTANFASGYVFDHWSGDVSGTSTSVTVTMDSDKEVTAHFKPIEYNLTVLVDPPGGGEVDPDPPGGSYGAGTPVELTASASSGYAFTRWGGDVSGTSTSVTVTMDSNKAVTAHFERVQYDLVTFVDPSEGGYVGLSPSGGTYDPGTEVTVAAFPALGYKFDRWSGDASGTAPSLTVTVDSNKSITAHFVPQYALTASVNPSGGGSVSLEPPGGTYDSGTSVTLTADPAPGYEFNHWSGDVSGTSPSVTVTMSSGKSVTAHFASAEGGAPGIQLGVGLAVIIILALVTVWFWRGRRRGGL